MNKEIYGKFWSPNHLLSFHRPLMLSIGSRGIGKSTGLGLHLIDEVYTKGRKFIYIRRTADETRMTAADYFYNPLSIYNDYMGTSHVWTFNKEVYTDENGEEVGYAFPLSLADKKKSTPYGGLGVRNIVYDEFILRRGLERLYIGNRMTPTLEYDLLWGLYQTVDRDKGHSFLNETKVFCLANFANLYNPIMLALDADKYVTVDSKIVAPKNAGWVIEFTDKVEATEEIKNSYSYQLAGNESKKTDYGNDGFIRSDNVKRLKGIMTPLINLKYQGRVYAVYMFEKDGVIYVNDKRSESVPEIALTMNDGRINQVVAVKYKNNNAMMMLRYFAEKGLVIFCTERARRDILTYLNFTI